MAGTFHARRKESLPLSLHMPESVLIYKGGNAFSFLLQEFCTSLTFNDTSRSLSRVCPSKFSFETAFYSSRGTKILPQIKVLETYAAFKITAKRWKPPKETKIAIQEQWQSPVRNIKIYVQQCDIYRATSTSSSFYFFFAKMQASLACDVLITRFLLVLCLRNHDIGKPNVSGLWCTFANSGKNLTDFARKK